MKSEYRTSNSRRSYLHMEFRHVAALCAGTVLTGSTTAASITINEVTVEDYEAGFSIEGNDLNTGGNGFYWSSLWQSSNTGNAYRITLGDSVSVTGTNSRYQGRCIRPVYD